MLAGVCVGTNDLDAASSFYDAVLATIGMERRMQNEHETGYGPPEGSASFWVLTPYDQAPATFGNGTQVMFAAQSVKHVQQFHACAMSLGGQDEGAPGLRNYAPGYYGAYCRDLDGNKLHVFYIQAETD